MDSVATFSYAAGALAFLALTVVLGIGWRGRVVGALLVVAAATNAVWGGLLAYSAWIGLQTPLWWTAVDVLRYGAWFAFLLSVLAAAGQSVLVRSLTWIAVALCAGQLGIVGTLAWLPEGAQSITLEPVVAPLVGSVLFAVLGLVLIEQLFRNVRPEGRWAVKYLCLGVGALFIYDLFLWSDALLLRHTDLQLWAARGAVNALVAPLIAVSAARNPGWSLDVYVSRRLVLHTATLVGAGVYLLLMALAGYFIRVYGGTWSATAQAVFLFGAVLILATLLLSERLRAQARVFLSKHFFNYKYDYREEWLRFTRTLSADNGESMPLKERVIRAIGQIVESPAGILWQRRGGVYVPTARWNLPDCVEASEAASGELALFLQETQWVLECQEWLEHPEHYRGIAMPDWMQRIPQAWLLVPLIHHEHLVGFVVLTRSRAYSFTLNWEDCDILKTVGRHAASYLAQEEDAEELGRARQFETFNRLSAFVVHDLKNVMAQLSMLAKNAPRHKHNPAFIDDAVSTIEHSVNRMNRLMGQLRSRNQTESLSEVDLVRTVEEVVEARSKQRPVPQFEGTTGPLRIMGDPGRLGAMLEHLIQNAQEATPPEGEVKVSLDRGRDWIVLEVRDTGEGMDSTFVRERLFKPFDTSKGSTGMGIGAFEAQEVARGLGGEVEVASSPGQGTSFRVYFPSSLVAEETEQAVQEAGH